MQAKHVPLTLSYPPLAPLFFGGRNTTSSVQDLLTSWWLGLFLAMLYDHAGLGIQMRSPACKVFAQFLSHFPGTHLILDHHVHCQCLFLFLLFSLVILMTKSHTYLLFTHLTVMFDRVLVGWCADPSSSIYFRAHTFSYCPGSHTSFVVLT